MTAVDELITPVIRAQDAEASAAWYARLGFTKDWEHRFAGPASVRVGVAQGTPSGS